MSNSAHESPQKKADSIALHFYTKLFNVVNDARATADQGPTTKPKSDKWFNLETPDSELFTREAQRVYKNISEITPPGPPPLEIQVLLSIPELTHNQVLVYNPPDSSRVRIEPTPRFILLESWSLVLEPHAFDGDLPLPTIYKHGIPLFRSLFSLLRILPAWKLYKRLKRRVGGLSVRNGNLGIQLRVAGVDGDELSGMKILGFDDRPSPTHPSPFPHSTHAFPSVPHPLGSIILTSTYLSTPNFQLDELESLLSSRFISLDLEGFVPTLNKNQARDSITGSSLPSSGSTGSGRVGGANALLSRSPPRAIGLGRATSLSGAAGTSSNYSTQQFTTSPSPLSPPPANTTNDSNSNNIADRFILPSRLSGAPAPSSIGSSANTGTSALIPPPRPYPTNSTSGATSNSTTPFPTSSSSSGVNQHGLSYSPHNRFRKESLGGSSVSASASASASSSSLSHHNTTNTPNNQPFPASSIPTTTSSSSPMASSPVPIRRPGIHPIPIPNVFKSGTVLSTPNSGANVGSVGGMSGSVSGSSASNSNSVARPGSSPLSAAGGFIHQHSRAVSLGGGSAGAAREMGGRYQHQVPPSPIGSGFTGGNATTTTTHSRSPSGSVNANASSTLNDQEHDWERHRRPSLLSSGAGLGISADGTGSGTPTTRKRYSSSFGHRYVGTGSAGSSVSAGGGTPAAGGGSPLSAGFVIPSPGGGVERRVSASAASGAGRGGGSSRGGSRGGSVDGRKGEGVAAFLTSVASPHDHHGHSQGDDDEDDDDISIFVQEIDSRKPLSGRVREREVRMKEREREEEEKERERGRRYASTTGHERYRSDATDSTDSTVRPGHGTGQSSFTPTPSGFRDYSTPSPSGMNLPLVPSPLSPAPPSRTSTMGSIGSTSSTGTVPATRTLSGGMPPLSPSPSPYTSSPVTTSPTTSTSLHSQSQSQSTSNTNPNANPQYSMSPTRGPMLTSQGEVDERLRLMNEAFLKSLEGMGSGSGSGSGKR